MGKLYFQEQEATKDILLRVSDLCSECYDNINLGDIIHYDLQQYRYVCSECEEKLNIKTNNVDISPYENSLF